MRSVRNVAKGRQVCRSALFQGKTAVRLGDPLCDIICLGSPAGEHACRRGGVELGLIRERAGGEARWRAMAAGVKFGRKPKLSPYLRAGAMKRRDAGETLAQLPSGRPTKWNDMQRRSPCARRPWDISMIHSIRSRRLRIDATSMKYTPATLKISMRRLRRPNIRGRMVRYLAFKIANKQSACVGLDSNHPGEGVILLRSRTSFSQRPPHSSYSGCGLGRGCYQGLSRAG
jgi:hypothetical protein